MSKGHFTGTFYRVEVKTDHPFTIGNKLITEKWTTLPTPEHGKDVFAILNRADPLAHVHGLLNYETAQALRWIAHANFESYVQTRLVKYKFEYRYEEIKEEEFDEMHWFDAAKPKNVSS